MESLGLNKLTKWFKAGSLKDKINWSINERQGIQRYIIFLVQIVSNKNNNILINTKEKIEIILWISIIFFELCQK